MSVTRAARTRYSTPSGPPQTGRRSNCGSEPLLDPTRPRRPGPASGQLDDGAGRGRTVLHSVRRRHMIRHRFGGHLRAARRGIRSPVEHQYTWSAVLEGIAIEGLEWRSGNPTGHAHGRAQIAFDHDRPRVSDRSDHEEERLEAFHSGGSARRSRAPCALARAAPAGRRAPSDDRSASFTVPAGGCRSTSPIWGVLSGADSTLGEDSKRGVEIAIDDKGGKLLGHDIR